MKNNKSKSGQTFIEYVVVGAILLWGLGCIFDDIGWITVYSMNKKRIMDSEVVDGK